MIELTCPLHTDYRFEEHNEHIEDEANEKV